MPVPRQIGARRCDRVQEGVAEVDLLVLRDRPGARVRSPEIENQREVVDRKQLDIALDRARIVAARAARAAGAEGNGERRSVPGAAAPTHHVHRGTRKIDVLHLRRRQPHRLPAQAPQVRIVRLPAGTPPPGIIAENIAIV